MYVEEAAMTSGGLADWMEGRLMDMAWGGLLILENASISTANIGISVHPVEYMY